MGLLKAKYPTYRFIGEESDKNEPLTNEPTFICDPVDGSAHRFLEMSLR
jgi:fructose-1,6-bisphosphatase/inositol monophosphatase family enzyme